MTRPALPSSGLEIGVDRRGGDTMVRLSGRVDVDSSPDLRNRLHAVLSEESPPRVVTVDLSAVAYIETSGVATLIEALRTARHRQSSLLLRGLNGAVLRLFEVTGVLALFEQGNAGQRIL